MKTLSDLKTEGLEKYIKKDKIDNYIDSSLSGDIKIKINDKIYDLKDFGSNININIDAGGDYNMFMLGKDEYIVIDRENLSALAVSPYSKEFDCDYVKNNIKTHVKFQVIKDSDIDESYITELKIKRNTDKDWSIGDSDWEKGLGSVAKICAFAAMANPIFGLCVVGSVVLGAGIFGLSKLFGKKDKKEDKKEDSDKNASKLLALAAAQAGTDKKAMKNFNDLLGIITNKNGDLDPDMCKKLTEFKDFQDNIDKVFQDAQKHGSDLEKGFNNVTDGDINNIKEYSKVQHEKHESESEISDLEKDLQEMKKQMEALQNQQGGSDDENIQNQIDELREQIEQKSKDIELKKSALEEVNSKSDSISAEIEDSLKDNAAVKDIQIKDPDDEDQPDDESGSDDEPDPDDVGDDEKNVPEPSDDSDPSKIYRKRKKNNGNGMTKNYYDKNGNGISQEEYSEMVSRYKKKHAQQHESLNTRRYNLKTLNEIKNV